jgi:hypothetical protein
MKFAFSHIPEGLDVPADLVEKHSRLFATMRLNETHFDRVAVHLVGALTHLDVDQALIDEAVAIVGPLRSVFETAAKEHAAYITGTYETAVKECAAKIASVPNKLHLRSLA